MTYGQLANLEELAGVFRRGLQFGIPSGAQRDRIAVAPWRIPSYIWRQTASIAGLFHCSADVSRASPRISDNNCSRLRERRACGPRMRD
jgi:hypothetical protein